MLQQSASLYATFYKQYTSIPDCIGVAVQALLLACIIFKHCLACLSLTGICQYTSTLHSSRRLNLCMMSKKKLCSLPSMWAQSGMGYAGLILQYNHCQLSWQDTSKMEDVCHQIPHFPHVPGLCQACCCTTVLCLPQEQ